jgi:hypothetical protein
MLHSFYLTGGILFNYFSGLLTPIVDFAIFTRHETHTIEVNLK